MDGTEIYVDRSLVEINFGIRVHYVMGIMSVDSTVANKIIAVAENYSNSDLKKLAEAEKIY